MALDNQPQPFKIKKVYVFYPFTIGMGYAGYKLGKAMFPSNKLSGTVGAVIGAGIVMVAWRIVLDEWIPPFPKKTTGDHSKD